MDKQVDCYELAILDEATGEVIQVYNECYEDSAQCAEGIAADSTMTDREVLSENCFKAKQNPETGEILRVKA